jgi:ribonuclease HI
VVPNLVPITEDLIRDAASSAGGWTKAKLAIIGVSWPPESGWQKKAVGKLITADQAAAFVAVKHLRVTPAKPRSSRVAKPKNSPLKGLNHPALGLIDESISKVSHAGIVVIQFDGSCEGNGLPNATGLWGFRIQIMGEPDRIGSGVTTADLVTNNVSEWQGLRAGLQACTSLAIASSMITRVLIQGDSNLVVQCVLGLWASKNPRLTTYRDECRNLLAEMNRPWFAAWIPREQNEYCDSLTRAQ